MTIRVNSIQLIWMRVELKFTTLSIIAEMTKSVVMINIVQPMNILMYTYVRPMQIVLTC